MSDDAELSLQELDSPGYEKIRTLLPEFGFFMVIEKGVLRFWVEIGQAPCLWLGAQSLRDCHSIDRYVSIGACMLSSCQRRIDYPSGAIVRSVYWGKDARALPSKEALPPFVLWRVTFLWLRKEKSLLERPLPASRPLC